MSTFVVLNEKGYVVGQGHHRAKATDAQVERALELLARGWGTRAVALELGVSRRTVREWRDCGKRAVSIAGSRHPVTPERAAALTAELGQVLAAERLGISRRALRRWLAKVLKSGE